MSKNKLFTYIKNNKFKLIKYSLWLFIGLIFIYVLYNEILLLNLSNIINTLSNQSLGTIISFIILGLISVSSMSIYDFVLCKEFDFKIKSLDIFKIAWISNTIGNFLGETAIEYGGLSYLLYKSEGIDGKRAKLISAIKTIPLGGRKNISFKFFDLSKKTRFLLILTSLLTWTISICLFIYIMISFNRDINIFLYILIFLLAMALGCISFIPGGLGVFEFICIVLFSTLGLNVEMSIIGLVVYRFVYYIIPCALSIVALSLNSIKSKKLKISDERKKILNIVGINSLSALIFFSGMFIIFTESIHGFMGEFKLVIFGTGVMLIILSNGIWNKVISSYYLTLVFLISAASLLILKYNMYIEGLVLLIVTLILKFAKDSFYRVSTKISLSCFIKSLIKVFIGLTSYIIIYNTLNSTIANSNNLLINDSSILWNEIFIYILIICLGSIILNLVTTKRCDFEPTSELDIDNLLVFLEKYEGNSMTHLLFLKDKNFFFAMDNQVLIAFRPYKDKLIALGDPIGDSSLFKEAINEFRLYAHNYNMTPVFYEISENKLPIYHENGFNFLKLGEEATVDISNFTLVGKKWQDLRTIKNKMKRGEIDFQLLTPPIDKEIFNKLKEISDEWLDGRKEKDFSLGRFDENYINLAPVGIVKKDGEIIGFATVMPNYCSHTVSIDLMRIIKNPPNGTMDALFVGIIDWAISQGYTKFVLGKAPLSNVGVNQFSPRGEKIAKYIYNYGNKLYSFKGLRRYKEKYDPEWKGIYLAYPKNSNLSVTVIQLTKLISGSNKN